MSVVSRHNITNWIKCLIFCLFLFIQISVNEVCSISINSIPFVYIASVSFQTMKLLESRISNSSFRLFVSLLLLRLVLIHFICASYQWFRIRCDDGNIPSFPMSRATCNLELKSVQMLSRLSRTVISFDIILSIIISCYHFMINIWMYVDGLMYDVSCYCFIFIFLFSNWKFGKK